jgi:hypothetical protein
MAGFLNDHVKYQLPISYSPQWLHDLGAVLWGEPQTFTRSNTRYCVDYRVPDRDDDSMYRKPRLT